MTATFERKLALFARPLMTPRLSALDRGRPGDPEAGVPRAGEFGGRTL